MCSCSSGDGGRGSGRLLGAAVPKGGAGAASLLGTGTGGRLLRTSVRESCAESCAMALLKRSGLTLKRNEPARRNESQMLRELAPASAAGSGGSSGERSAVVPPPPVAVAVAVASPKNAGAMGGSTGTPGGGGGGGAAWSGMWARG